MFAFLTFLSTVAGWIAWLGVGLLPVAVAAAVIWFFPPFRRIAILAAAFWLTAFIALTVGDTNGARRVTSEWKAAEQRAIERGSDVREQAEKEIPPVVGDPAPAACEPAPPPAAVPATRRWPWPRRVRDNDPYNRDNH